MFGTLAMNKVALTKMFLFAYKPLMNVIGLFCELTTLYNAIRR